MRAKLPELEKKGSTLLARVGRNIDFGEFPKIFCYNWLHDDAKVTQSLGTFAELGMKQVRGLRTVMAPPELKRIRSAVQRPIPW